jgi:hypothetical protein
MTQNVPIGSPSERNSPNPAKKRIVASPLTRGLLRNSWSARASFTTNSSVCRIACAQNATSRGVSPIFSISDARYHWCRSSSSVTRPIGVPQRQAASCTSSSHSSSGWESNSSRVQIALKVAASASVRRTFIHHRKDKTKDSRGDLHKLEGISSAYESNLSRNSQCGNTPKALHSLLDARYIPFALPAPC